MSAVLVAAMVWPAVVLVVALLLGRMLRSTDRQEEQQRCDATAAAAALPFRVEPNADPGRRLAAGARGLAAS